MKKRNGITVIIHRMIKIDKKDVNGLKYYIGFVLCVVLFYMYSMFTGLRYLSFDESHHSKERNSYSHK